MAEKSRAERQRRYRARSRRGEAVLRVRVGYFRVIEALLRSTRLSEQDALDRTKVERAVSEVVQEWARRWAE